METRAVTTRAAPASPLDASRIGFEGRAAVDDHLAVKVWLRLLSCSTQVEQEIRDRLHRRFGTTLPRFDYLAQLQRHPEGLRMTALSRYLMVTGSNVTGLTDQLVAQGLVERGPAPDDRRSMIVRLTADGRRQFALMAREHEAWLADLFDGCEPGLKETLYEMLGRLRVHLAQRAAAGAAPAAFAPAATPGTTPAARRPGADRADRPAAARPNRKGRTP